MRKESWPQIVTSLKKYRPRLHYQSVLWQFPERHKLKYNTDGVSRGNPRLSAIAFYIENDKGYLVITRVIGIGVTTNMEVETRVVQEALRIIQTHKLI